MALRQAMTWETLWYPTSSYSALPCGFCVVRSGEKGALFGQKMTRSEPIFIIERRREGDDATITDSVEHEQSGGTGRAQNLNDR